MYMLHACRVADEVPGLVHFVQSALNTRAHTEMSEVELLMDMSQARMAMGADADWSAIESSASNNYGPAVKYVKVLAAVTKLQPHECIEDLSGFFKMHAAAGDNNGTTRFMGSEWFARMANLSFGKIERYPWVINAAIKANLISKDQKLVDGFCKLITTGHLSSITSASNRATVKHMEKIMSDCRALCTKVQLSGSDKSLLVGKLDTRLFLHFCKLSKFGDGTFASLDAIGQAWPIHVHS